MPRQTDLYHLSLVLPMRKPSPAPLHDPHHRHRPLLRDLALGSRRLRFAAVFLCLAVPLLLWHQPVVSVTLHWPGTTQFLNTLEKSDGLPDAVALADKYYKLGLTDTLSYRHSLEAFVVSSFPPHHQPPLLAGLVRYLPLGYDLTQVQPLTDDLPAMVDYKYVWQTSKEARPDTGSWVARNLEWSRSLLDDESASAWIRENFRASHIKEVWDDLPAMILKADMLRYLLVLKHGGVYSDVDTICLKPIPWWGNNPTLWKGGKGWLDPSHIDECPDCGRPSVVIGIEVDALDRERWTEYWPRPLQLAQWTFASAPSHPILIDAVARIVSATEGANVWTAERDLRMKELRAAGRDEEVDALAKIDVVTLQKPNPGGYLDIMEWTGPGVFTDAVFRYLRARYDFHWSDLRNITAPLRVGDVVILPITGFSPGMEGAGDVADSQAMVDHLFAGSWKEQ